MKRIFHPDPEYATSMPCFDLWGEGECKHEFHEIQLPSHWHATMLAMLMVHHDQRKNDETRTDY